MDLKWKKVVYYDENNVRKTLSVDNIQADKDFVNAKTIEVFYDFSETFDLRVRDKSIPSGSRHFYELNTDRTLFLEKEDQLHDEYISTFIMQICDSIEVKETNHSLKVNYKKIEFSCWDFSREGYGSGTKKSIIDLTQYLWNTEVVNEIGDNKYARHDIVALPIELGISKKRPRVIIEVVNYHFVNSEVFNYFINISKQSNTIVIFLFVKNNSKYNNGRFKSSVFNQTVSCYIKNGVFIYCGIKTFPLHSDIFENVPPENLYYSTIYHLIVKMIMSDKVNLTDLKKTFLTN